ncbi:MAG: hypothetical protein E6Q97_17000, partial [Desulfurellales bacterium]
MSAKCWRLGVLAIVVGIGVGIALEHGRPRSTPTRPAPSRPAPSRGHPTPGPPRLKDAVPIGGDEWDLVGVGTVDGLWVGG